MIDRGAHSYTFEHFKWP